MKIERNEFMLCVDVLSELELKPPYKDQILGNIEADIIDRKLDKQYSVNRKQFIKMLQDKSEDDFAELYHSIKAYWGRRDQDYSMIGEKHNILVTSDNYSSIKGSLKRFLILEVEKYALRAGSIEALGLKLGQSEKYAQMVLKRGSFSALERLWKECIEKMRA